MANSCILCSFSIVSKGHIVQNCSERSADAEYIPKWTENCCNFPLVPDLASNKSDLIPWGEQLGKSNFLKTHQHIVQLSEGGR